MKPRRPPSRPEPPARRSPLAARRDRARSPRTRTLAGSTREDDWCDGGSGTDDGFERVTTEWKPGRHGNGTSKRFHRGMRRVPGPASHTMIRDAESKVAPEPKCSAARLMRIARSQAALPIPARILYDTEGYELRTGKKGGSLDLYFDHDCELVAR